jgi:hypothetical protein
MQNLYGVVPKLKDLSILREVYGETGLCTRSKDDRRTRGLGQIQMAAHKISMEVGFEDVFDLYLSLFCQPEVDIDIPKWVNDRSFPFTVNEIGRFTQTPGIQLLNKHRLKFLCYSGKIKH